MHRRFRKGSNRFAYIVGFVFCVLFPAFVTGIAPVSVTRFERQGQEIVARSSANLLFVIPYRRVQVDGVTAVDDRFHEGELSVDHSAGDSIPRQVRSEDEAFFVIHGRNGQAEVSVSPASIGSVMEKARAFLATPTERELRLVTVANWKFGVIAGGFLSLFTVLYLVGVVISLWRLITGYEKPDVPPHKWKPQ
jgi:hypothetical protein